MFHTVFLFHSFFLRLFVWHVEQIQTIHLQVENVTEEESGIFVVVAYGIVERYYDHLCETKWHEFTFCAVTLYI